MLTFLFIFFVRRSISSEDGGRKASLNSSENHQPPEFPVRSYYYEKVSLVEGSRSKIILEINFSLSDYGDRAVIRTETGNFYRRPAKLMNSGK